MEENQMKRILSGVLALLILLFSLVGCSNNSRFLAEEDFNIYSGGKLYLDIDDSLGGEESYFAIFNEGAETFRGLKVNDTVTKVKELYGNETIYIKIKETNSLEKKSVTEFIRTVVEDNYKIQFERIYIDGKLYDLKQLAEFPVGTKYTSKMLSIEINGVHVSEIRVDYGRFTLYEEAKKAING